MLLRLYVRRAVVHDGPRLDADFGAERQKVDGRWRSLFSPSGRSGSLALPNSRSQQLHRGMRGSGAILNH